MAFDIHALTDFAYKAIQDFAVTHTNETFYAFAVDENLLCLNSIEKFSETLAYYTDKYPPSYSSADAVDELRANTGDWAYQGFAAFSAECGFDFRAYDEHYMLGLHDANDTRLNNSDYALAMASVLNHLLVRDSFSSLQRTADFKLLRVEHSY